MIKKAAISLLKRSGSDRRTSAEVQPEKMLPALYQGEGDLLQSGHFRHTLSLKHVWQRPFGVIISKPTRQISQSSPLPGCSCLQ